MKTIKVAAATEQQLNWLVAKCDGKDVRQIPLGFYQGGELVFVGEYNWDTDSETEVKYTTDWSQMGPIIDRERIGVWPSEHGDHETHWGARMLNTFIEYGNTGLIAAARCYVVSKLGETVEVPEEL